MPKRSVTLSCILLLILATGLSPATSAAAPAVSTPPPLPSSFYGEIRLPLNPPALSDTVQVSLPQAAGPVVTAGTLMAGTVLAYRLDIPGDIPETSAREGGLEGEALTFRLGAGVVAVGRWHSGTNARLDFHPPQADPGGPYSADEGTPVAFQVTPQDAGNDVTGIAWDWDGDGTDDATGAGVTHTWQAAGTHTVSLELADAQGAQTVYPITVTIRDLLPTAASAGGPYKVRAKQDITLTGSADCSAGDVCTFAWDLDEDGVFGEAGETGRSVTFTAAHPGEYPVSLRVSDDEGNVVGAAGKVHVTGPQTVKLEPGWNLVPGEALLASATGAYDLAYTWDAEHQAWQTYAPSAPAAADGPDSVDALQGYWVHAAAAITVEVDAALPAEEGIHLYPGWNLVSYPAGVELPLPAALEDYGVGADFTQVYAYDAGAPAGSWALFDRTKPGISQGLASLVPAHSYWILATAEHIWVLP
jgi:hypothetical protein